MRFEASQDIAATPSRVREASTDVDRCLALEPAGLKAGSESL